MDGVVPSGVVMLTLMGTDGGVREGDGEGGRGIPRGDTCAKRQLTYHV